MEWLIGFIVIVVIVAVVWWLLNRGSGRAESPDSLNHAPATLQHGFSDVGQQAPTTFSNHDASTPSAGAGAGGKAAMSRDEASARRAEDAAPVHAAGSSRVEHEPVNPNEPFLQERMAAGTDAEERVAEETGTGPDHRAQPRGEAAPDHQGSGVDSVTENSSGDWDLDESEAVVSRGTTDPADGPAHRSDS